MLGWHGDGGHVNTEVDGVDMLLLLVFYNIWKCVGMKDVCSCTFV